MSFDWLDSLLGALGMGGLLAWLGKREINRIDALASQKADRAEIQQMLAQLKERDDRAAQAWERIHDVVADVRDRVSHIEGRLQKGPVDSY